MSLSGRVVLITGAAGFLGGHLAEAARAAGARIRALDDLSAGTPDPSEAPRDDVRFVAGDLRDPAVLAPLAEGADVIFHLAARGAASHGFADPVGDHDVNAQGTLAVLEAARAARVRRVVLASSWRVYGASGGMPLVETLSPAPDSPHAIQKHAAEVYATLYAQLHGFETVSLRYFPIFGPRQRAVGDASEVLALAEAQAADEALPPAVDAAPAAEVDLIFVADAVQATLLAATAERAGSGIVVNVGSGRPAGDSPALALLRPEREGGRRSPTAAVADLARAEDVLGFSTRVGVEQGFSQTVAWLRDTKRREGGQ